MCLCLYMLFIFNRLHVHIYICSGNCASSGFFFINTEKQQTQCKQTRSNARSHKLNPIAIVEEKKKSCNDNMELTLVEVLALSRADWFQHHFPNEHRLKSQLHIETTRLRFAFLFFFTGGKLMAIFSPIDRN